MSALPRDTRGDPCPIFDRPKKMGVSINLETGEVVPNHGTGFLDRKDWSPPSLPASLESSHKL